MTSLSATGPWPQLAAAAVSGPPPAGPAVRRRPVRRASGPHDDPEIRGPLVVADHGFNRHARTRQLIAWCCRSTVEGPLRRQKGASRGRAEGGQVT